MGLVADSNTEITALIAELKAAQQEVQAASAQGILDAQRPLLGVLKVELAGRIKALAGQVRQRRWLLRELLENEADQQLLKTVRLLREQGAPTLVEQVEAIVTAKSTDQKN